MTCRANFVFSCGFKFALENFLKKSKKMCIRDRQQPAPPNGERKKPLPGRLLSCAHFTNPSGGFEKSRPPLSFARRRKMCIRDSISYFAMLLHSKTPCRKSGKTGGMSR